MKWAQQVFFSAGRCCLASSPGLSFLHWSTVFIALFSPNILLSPFAVRKWFCLLSPSLLPLLFWTGNCSYFVRALKTSISFTAGCTAMGSLTFCFSPFKLIAFWEPLLCIKWNMQEEIENAICEQLDVGLHCEWGWRKPENLCSCLLRSLLPLILSSLCLSTNPGLVSDYDLNPQWLPTIWRNRMCSSGA